MSEDIWAQSEIHILTGGTFFSTGAFTLYETRILVFIVNFFLLMICNWLLLLFEKVVALGSSF